MSEDLAERAPPPRTPAPRVRTFHLPSSSTSSDPLLHLALARKADTFLLVHASALPGMSPKERQHAILNALVAEDPFPDVSERGCVQMWLKVGPGKQGEEGGENVGLLEGLVEAGVVRDTGARSSQGVIQYPKVEVLVSPGELCHVCATCGEFEDAGAELDRRFKRCARCRLVYYCSTVCHTKDWKMHKPVCLDLPHDDDASIEAARRKGLLRLYGRHVVPVGPGGRSKMD